MSKNVFLNSCKKLTPPENLCQSASKVKGQRGQELIIDILYWFFLQWEKFIRDYDLKGG